MFFFIIVSFSLIPSSFAWHTPSNLPSSKIEVSSNPIKSKNFDFDGYLTRPTFGLDHSNDKKVVDFGFKLNEKRFSISNNFHTPFVEQTINIGEQNTFEAKVFADRGLRVQEFLFGIPEVGEAHKAEVGIEVWFNYQGGIENIEAVQETNVIDPDHILATHEKVKCLANSDEKECDLIRISVIFLEPLHDKIMALKAIDFKGRYQITYLNEGISLSGESLNPMQIAIIPSPTRNEGPIKITQIEKYSVIWKTEDGRIFERNSFGSFRPIIENVERFQDSGEPRTRNHSDFGHLLIEEELRAFRIFNATNLESELPGTFSYEFPDQGERIDNVMKERMNVQELLALEIIEKSNIQARFSNINS